MALVSLVSFVFVYEVFKMGKQLVCISANLCNPAGIYLLKVSNRNTGTRCGICSQLTIKTPKRHQWRRFGVFIITFEHIPLFAQVFIQVTLNM